MRKGTHHSKEAREKISKGTKKAMMNPDTHKKILKTAFKKGHTPYNKGMKRGSVAPDTEFKEGVTTGENHPSWKGGVQKPKNDCAYLWDGTNKRKRRPREIYKEAYGEIPDGYVIWHIDGNNKNDDPSNLEAISRGEMMKRNFKKRWKTNVQR